MAVFINLNAWETFVFLLLNLALVGSVEPEQYVYRGSTKTCLTVFDCEENHYVKVCSVSGTRETCEPCKKGEVQPNLVSSIDDDEKRKCFRPKDIYDCPIEDTVHSRTPYNAIHCNKPCRCNTNKCYWGEPCICKHKDTPCGVGEELDVNTGECRPCPKGKHKTTVGCGPCRFITSPGKVPTDSHPNNATENTKDEIPEIPSTITEIVLILAGVVVAILLIALAVVSLRLRYRMRKLSHSKVSLDPEKADAEVKEEEVTVNGRPETPGNEETPLLPEKEPDHAEENKGTNGGYSIQESQSHTSSDIPDSSNDTAEVSKLPVQVNDVDNTRTAGSVSPEYRAIHQRDQFSVDGSSVSTDVNMNCIISRSTSIPTENEEDTDPKSNCSQTDMSEKCIVNGPSIPIEGD